VLRALQPALQSDTVKLSETFPVEKSAALLKACAEMGLEGVVMKRKGSVYRPGFRSPDWIKVPLRHSDEFVVAGYLPSARGFSTLILGQYNRQGTLAYAGFCGNGLSDNMRTVILAELQAIHRKTCPSCTVPNLRDEFRELPDTPPQWVRPGLVVKAEYRQRLRDGLRHAVVKGICPDKRPRPIRCSLPLNVEDASTLLARRRDDRRSSVDLHRCVLRGRLRSDACSGAPRVARDFRGACLAAVSCRCWVRERRVVRRGRSNRCAGRDRY
jgi:ATP-dependent DNA ligase